MALPFRLPIQTSPLLTSPSRELSSDLRQYFWLPGERPTKNMHAKNLNQVRDICLKSQSEMTENKSYFLSLKAKPSQ